MKLTKKLLQLMIQLLVKKITITDDLNTIQYINDYLKNNLKSFNIVLNNDVIDIEWIGMRGKNYYFKIYVLNNLITILCIYKIRLRNKLYILSLISNFIKLNNKKAIEK